MSIATLIKVEVTPVGSLNITPVIDATSVEGKVGDTGQLNVKPIEGIEGSKGTLLSLLKIRRLLKSMQMEIGKP
ncbi:hypothetical protein GQR36_17875 [Enterococcus termitis]